MLDIIITGAIVAAAASALRALGATVSTAACAIDRSPAGCQSVSWVAAAPGGSSWLWRRSSGFVVQEQLLEPGGDRVLLLSAERFEECLVGGDQFMKRLPGDLAALRGETDEHPAPVGRVGGAADEPGLFEPVEP